MGQEFLGEGERFSDESGYALAQCEIEAFDVVGLALLFRAGLMLWGGHNAVVGKVEVGVAQGAFVAVRNLVPQHLATQRIPFSIPPRYNLPGSSTQRQPNPHLVLFVAHKAPHLIQLQHLALLCGQKRGFEIAGAVLFLLLDQLLCLFFKRSATVTRDTLSARLMPL